MKAAATILGAAVACLLVSAATPAWAINKCTAPDGKVSFQAQPCPVNGGAIEVKPSSGMAPTVAPSTAASATSGTPSTAATPVTGAPKQGVFGEAYRRKLDRESHLISNTRGQLNGHLQSCE